MDMLLHCPLLFFLYFGGGRGKGGKAASVERRARPSQLPDQSEHQDKGNTESTTACRHLWQAWTMYRVDREVKERREDE